MSARSLMNPDAQLVGALLEAGDAFVSGSDLAKLLGMSRPAVWARLQKLEAAGFVLEAVRNRGHRLRGQPACLHPALLEWWAHRQGLAWPIIYLPSVDSTNSEAERQFQQGRIAPFCIVSSEQRAGRGRRGRVWLSESAHNLYLSLALAPDLPPQVLSGLTLWAGIYLARGLNAHYLKSTAGALAADGIGLKWPNDLEFGGRKLGGLLTEAKSDSDGIRQLVIGLGLNVGAQPQLERGIALAEAAQVEFICLNRLAVNCVKWLLAAYAAVIDGVDAEGLGLSQAYAPLDRLFGKDVQAYRQREIISGQAIGIDTCGALLLRQADGKQVAIDAGEVTLQAGQ